ncbi:MAG: peptide MFS transporter [Pseudomonadota bacterium]|nr:peptide MFS transporter [Pseudomonadota bacterium]
MARAMVRPDRTDAVPRIFGHPASLFVLFFTEMWERFSYYGMRSLLVLFLIADSKHGGWGWSRAEALQLYGWYTGLVFFTPLIGGYIADRWLGSGNAVRAGGLIISAGHACLLLDTPAAFFLGLALIVSGTGLFKPNISVMVGQLYGANNEQLRDAGYTLFYMGVNSGAFFGTLLCGYLGETVSWHLGFGLAGLFMLLGTMQFYFAGGTLDSGGDRSTAQMAIEATAELPGRVVADRLQVVYLLSFFAIFFWFAYEQAGGAMTIFASAYADRVLDANSSKIFKIVNGLMSVVSALILSWVMGKLFAATGRRALWSNLLLGTCLGLVWMLLAWILLRTWTDPQLSVPATWFGVLPAFFIVLFAPALSRIWERYWNPDGPVKFGIGLLLLGGGFAVLAYGARGIPSGASTGTVGMAFLVVAYWLHTMGELCISPVGLSLISKLAPARLLGLMFGVWFLNAAIAIKLAGLAGSYIDRISSAWSMSTFFLIFAVIPALAGLVIMALNKWMAVKMHGVR